MEEPGELGTVIAERELEILVGGTVAGVARVRMGLPAAEASGDFTCPVQVAGLGDDRVRLAWGQDSFVALQNGLVLIELLLKQLAPGHIDLRWQSGSPGDLGFPMPRSA
ncbi:MAG TPA: hypothetical protein VN428_03345 [Bryobacteraceae bacterium]|nr:hypothetical protein [Bryobacteraceae bacterium]